jgi:broad-specificity NMP kinase
VGCGERGDDHIRLSVGLYEFVDVFKVDLNELIVDEVRVCDVMSSSLMKVAGEVVKIFSWIRNDFDLDHVGPLRKLSYKK